MFICKVFLYVKFYKYFYVKFFLQEGEEDSESVSKKMSPVSRTPKPIHFFSPFYVFASDIKFSAKKHEIFYFFGGDLKVFFLNLH